MSAPVNYLGTDIVKIGRDLAAGLLADAASLAVDREMFQNHLGILQVKASHILAALVFNSVELNGAIEAEGLDNVIGGIKKELAYIKQQSALGNIELSGVKASPSEVN